MFLDGIGISGYRSFGNEMQFLAELSKVNVIIGKNNSGKSNIARFLKSFATINNTQVHRLSELNLFNEQLDLHKSDDVQGISISLQIKKDSVATGHLYEKIEEILPGLRTKIPEWSNTIWIPFNIANLTNPVVTQGNLDRIKRLIADAYTSIDLSSLVHRHFHVTGGDNEYNLAKIAEVFNLVSSFKLNVEIIDNFRKIDSTDVWNHNGRGLIYKLNQLKEPVLGKENDRERFTTINNFLKEILNNDSAYIDIPHTVDQLYVYMDNKRLPLDSLGTGIQQVIVLAAAVTLIEDSIVFVEEPEVYLHPELQKKFIKYIMNNTTNQYILTTHSNAVFDNFDVNIYHLKLESGSTKCKPIYTSQEKGHIIEELGYKSSDILQSNCVIWVEGPSDRIYLQKWINDIDATLIEGLHYSIMFYGGRLLSHLSAEDDEISEFIKLGKINRHSAMLIDSDKRNRQTQLNDTKKRIIHEFESSGRFVWVTKGREIENYLSEEFIRNGITSLYGANARLNSYGQYDDVTTYMKGTQMKNVDKIKIARLYNELATSYTYDLRDQIINLVSFIHRANGID